MRKLLLATAALVALALPAQATVFNIVAPDPTSQQGNFSLAPGAGAFTDQVTFSITGPSTFTIANATNTFATAADQILNWQASIWDSVDGIVGNAGDVLLFGPQGAGACFNVPNCQTVGGSGFLNGPSLFYAQFTGTGSGTSGYSGNISTVAAVPVPGAVWLFGSALAGLALLRNRRRQVALLTILPRLVCERRMQCLPGFASGKTHERRLTRGERRRRSFNNDQAQDI